MGSMALITIRDYGNTRFAVYTDDRETAQRLSRLNDFILSKPYWQQGGQVVAWDLVFSSSARAKVIRMLEKDSQLKLEVES